MGQLIDTSVLITWERSGQPIATLAAAINAEEHLALASITVSELFVGAHRADTIARRLRREAVIEAILVTIPVLPFDLMVARVHARVWADLMRTGRPIGNHDLLIAATALAHGHSVLTENPRDFQRVPDLIVRQPTG